MSFLQRCHLVRCSDSQTEVDSFLGEMRVIGGADANPPLAKWSSVIACNSPQISYRQISFLFLFFALFYISGICIYMTSFLNWRCRILHKGAYLTYALYRTISSIFSNSSEAGSTGKFYPFHTRSAICTVYSAVICLDAVGRLTMPNYVNRCRYRHQNGAELSKQLHVNTQQWGIYSAFLICASAIHSTWFWARVNPLQLQHMLKLKLHAAREQSHY